MEDLAFRRVDSARVDCHRLAAFRTQLSGAAVGQLPTAVAAAEMAKAEEVDIAAQSVASTLMMDVVDAVEAARAASRDARAVPM